MPYRTSLSAVFWTDTPEDAQTVISRVTDQLPHDAPEDWLTPGNETLLAAIEFQSEYPAEPVAPEGIEVPADAR